MAFYNCSSLKNIYITDMAAWCSISGLGQLMSYGSGNIHLYLNGEEITELVIPDSVTNICNAAFYNCSSIESVLMENENESSNIRKIQFG